LSGWLIRNANELVVVVNGTLRAVIRAEAWRKEVGGEGLGPAASGQEETPALIGQASHDFERKNILDKSEQTTI
jgi:hypothetical protein